MQVELDYLLEQTVAYGASDLHLCAGIPPVIRIHGDLAYLNEAALTPKDCEEMSRKCVREDLWETIATKGQVDLSYSINGSGRFRVNVFRQRATLAVAAGSFQLRYQRSKLSACLKRCIILQDYREDWFW